MLAFRWLTGVLIVGALGSAQLPENRFPDEPKAILEKAEQVELISLTPEKDNSKDGFEGFKLLGKTVVKDAETRKAILAALHKGIADSDGKCARSLYPRHAIQATHDGKS